MKTLDRIVELLTKLLPIAGVFGALMYFVGRIYIERYYDTMGVPSDILGFGTTDFVFEGAHPWRIIIVLIFTLLGVLLFRFGIPESFPFADDIKDQPKLLWTEMKALYTEVRKQTKTLNNAVGFFWMVTYNFMWAFFLVIISAGLFGSRTISQDLCVLIFSVGAAGSTILLLSDETATLIIKRSKILSWPFFLVTIVVFLIYPYVTAGSYGSAMGALDAQQHRLDDVFQEVQLTTEKPIAGLQWEQQDNGFWTTEGTLYLLTVRDDNLFVRPEGEDARVIVVPTKNITSYSLSVVQMFPPLDETSPKDNTIQ